MHPKFQVATALLFDRNGKLLIYQRDNNPVISFPGHWDLFGGIIEAGETPEEALVREVKEELGITLSAFTKFKTYDTEKGEPFNRKHVFYARINYLPEELTLTEGQELISIKLEERHRYRFANILGLIVDEFVAENR